VRRAARIDRIHKDIVKVFREMGCSVTSLAAVGKGVPDLLVGIGNRNLLVEVKSGHKKHLTEDQVIFRDQWHGQHAVVHDVEEAISLVLENAR
jgi:hypothetical protein